MTVENYYYYDPIIRDIPGYPNYQISEFGEIYDKTTGNKISTNYINKNGYYEFKIKKKKLAVHRLLAIIFLKNPYNYKFVKHINKNKLDNHLENLQWVEKRPLGGVILGVSDYKDIQGYNYIITRVGDVYNKESGLKLKQRLDNKGYFFVGLYDKNGEKQLRVHRLLAEAFIPNPNCYPIVDHINRQRTDNRIENLRWVNGSQNATNITLQKNNKSGHTGVYFDKTRNKWISMLEKNGKTYRYYFENSDLGLEDAIKWRKELEKKYHTYD